MSHHEEFFIDGEWVPSLSGDTHPVVDPSTGQQIALIAMAGVADVDRAVAAARAAFPAWSATDPQERRELVVRILDAYRARVDDMGTLISREMGAPIDRAIGAQAGSGVSQIERFLKAFDEVKFVEAVDPDEPGARLARFSFRAERPAFCGLALVLDRDGDALTASSGGQVAMRAEASLQP